VINSSYTSPGIYPNILPDGTQNQPYNEDVTFVMFTDTMGFAVNYFKINGISGLPLGLVYECNNISNGCQYNPQSSIYGCVKVCGTPIQTGTFTAAVSVTANLQVVGNQNSTINIPITIYPASGGNSGFTFSPASACGSAQVTFQGLINNPSYINSYNWDFGNGNTSDQQNPPVQNYDTAGTYYVSLQTQFSVYSLSSLAVNSVNNNWCGDVEEPNLFGCVGSPDLYVVITDASSDVVYTSPTIDNVNSATWNNINIPLNNPPYSFTIWDEDVISTNDILGTFSFNPVNTGTFNYSGNGTSGNYTISTEVVTTFNSTDSVMIYPFPEIPLISVLGNDTICSGDTVVLKAWSPDAQVYNWYNADVIIAGETDSLLTVLGPGLFKAEAINQYGCSSFSLIQTITQQPPLPNVNFSINGNTLTTFLSGYNFQWLLNGTDITGATSSTYTITQQGSYSLRACDNFGCCRTSDALTLTPVSVSSISNASHIRVYPNPAKNSLNIDMVDLNNNAFVELFDITGRLYINEVIERSSTLDISQLPNGIYMLRIVADDGIYHQKVVIEK
jgi:PKD repeat protein